MFFYCSGYSLFLSKQCSFGNYYKRRVARIYPSVFMVALLASAFWGDKSTMLDVIVSGMGWFIPCIMLYYVPLYFIRRYGEKRRLLVCAITAVVVGLYLAQMDFPEGYVMYGAAWPRWVFFFIFMLQGAYARKLQEGETSAVASFVKLLLSVALFYAVLFLSGRYGVSIRCQVLSLVPLLMTCHYFHRLCNAQALVSCYQSKWGREAQLVSGLCLEIYLIQAYLFTDKLNFLFPLNLLIVFAEIVAAAYFLRCLSRLFVQTLTDREYDWKAVFKL